MTFSSPLDCARWWINQGFAPVPVHYKSKRPVDDAWQELRVNAGNVAQHFNGKAQNIGLLLGLAGAVDADLDYHEAIAIGPAYLPFTELIWGRESKRCSHWLYRCEGLRTRQFKDPITGKAIVEVRGLDKDGGVGLQTVAPHSIHATGEAIEFVKAGTAATVDGKELMDAASVIAAGGVLARYWPIGGRHTAMLALSGILARAGWDVDRAKKFCREVYCAVQTHDPRAVGRSDSEVESTFKKHGAGEEVTGFPTLAEAIPYEICSTACEWLGCEVPDWRNSLIVSKTGPKPVLANAITALRNAPAWGRVLKFNQFAQRVVADSATPWGKTGTLDNNDLTCTADWLQHQGILVSSKIAGEAAGKVARERAFHPVRDYLRSVAWDGVARLPFWLSWWLGAPVNDYTKAVGTCWPISAVARVERPGCQCDHVLTLIGRQNIGKSSTLRILAGEWFSDRLSDLSSKDAAIELAGIWIVEFSELAAVRRSDLHSTKSFLSRTTDRYRPPFGIVAEDHPRQSVFCATANESDLFIDATGNRRYWPISCGDTIELETIRDFKDQIWGEAFARYQRGEAWWFQSDDLNKLATLEQEKHYEPGQWDELIEDWIAAPNQRPEMQQGVADPPWHGSRPGKVNITDVLTHCIGIQPEHSKQANYKDVARCLKHLGWREGKKETTGQYRNKRYWISPQPPGYMERL